MHPCWGLVALSISVSHPLLLLSSATILEEWISLCDVHEGYSSWPWSICTNTAGFLGPRPLEASHHADSEASCRRPYPTYPAPLTLPGMALAGVHGPVELDFPPSFPSHSASARRAPAPAPSHRTLLEPLGCKRGAHDRWISSFLRAMLISRSCSARSGHPEARSLPPPRTGKEPLMVSRLVVTAQVYLQYNMRVASCCLDSARSCCTCQSLLRRGQAASPAASVCDSWHVFAVTVT